MRTPTPWRVETILPYPRLVYGPTNSEGFADDIPMTIDNLNAIADAINTHGTLVAENERLRSALRNLIMQNRAGMVMTSAWDAAKQALSGEEGQ